MYGWLHLSNGWTVLFNLRIVFPSTTRVGQIRYSTQFDDGLCLSLGVWLTTNIHIYIYIYIYIYISSTLHCGKTWRCSASTVCIITSGIVGQLLCLTVTANLIVALHIGRCLPRRWRMISMIALNWFHSLYGGRIRLAPLRHFPLFYLTDRRWRHGSMLRRNETPKTQVNEQH